MKKNIIYLFLICVSCLLSCINSSEKMEYYDDGTLFKEYSVDRGKLNGMYREFYSNGNLRVTHNYNLGIKKDTSFYYYDSRDKKVELERIWLQQDSIKQIEFYKNGKIRKTGIINSKQNKIGKWNFYDKTGGLEATREYKNILGEEYLNQEWYFDSEGDTLFYPSHYIKLIKSTDTIYQNESLKGIVILELPLLKNEISEIYLVLPKKGYNFNKDFSNEAKIKVDTFFSLNKDLENRKWFPDSINFKNTVTFVKDITKRKSGNKMIRGYVVEYYEQPPDSLGVIKKEHKKYFEIPIYIKDDSIIK